METLKKILVSPETAILHAIEAIDAGGIQIVFVVTKDKVLVGTVTDGDVRRGILLGIPLSEPVKRLMNQQPVVARADQSREEILSLMQRQVIRVIPIIDASGQIVGIETLEQLLRPEHRKNWVLIMAGGAGTRLRPLTEHCPKPLLKVGGRPILEIILQNLIEGGFSKFLFSVNYKAEMIRNYFKDGEAWNVDIDYVQETEPLGTAGALSLIPELPSEPMLVVNGDVITKLNFGSVLDFHVASGVTATMCVRQYEFQVPYGVVNVDGHEFLAIEEKPVQRFFVNAGVYAINPEALGTLPKDQFYNMTDFFTGLRKRNEKVGVFPIREYWIDVGRHDDLQRANFDSVE